MADQMRSGGVGGSAPPSVRVLSGEGTAVRDSVPYVHKAPSIQPHESLPMVC